MRVVIKLGSRTLLDDSGKVDEVRVGWFVDQIAELKKHDVDVILVSSGAVATGRALMADKHQRRSASSPLLATLGQAELMWLYNRLFKTHGFMSTQVLLTRQDFKTRQHDLNLKELFEETLLNKNLVAIVNENDALLSAPSFTDNDELAGLIAAQVKAERLVILSSIDGVYDRPPAEEGAEFVAEVTPKIFDKIKVGDVDAVGRGGMASKLKASLRLAEQGVETTIASSDVENVLVRLILQKEKIGSRILAQKPKAFKGVKRWLAGGVAEVDASIVVDDKLAELLCNQDGAVSILPVGIAKIHGDFEKGAMIEVQNKHGEVLGFGIARYRCDELKDYMGLRDKPKFINYDQLFLKMRGDICQLF